MSQYLDKQGLHKVVEGLKENIPISKGITEGSIQAGVNSYAGCKGYYIRHMSSNGLYVMLYTSGSKYSEDELTSDSFIKDEMTSDEHYDSSFKSGYTAGDIVTIFNGQHYAYCATISGVDGNIFNFQKHYHLLIFRSTLQELLVIEFGKLTRYYMFLQSLPVVLFFLILMTMKNNNYFQDQQFLVTTQ